MVSPKMSPYRPLSSTDISEIRVVKISPAAHDDPVRCELEHASLDSQPDYWTLSYVWGDTSTTGAISLNGQEFHVTTNLLSFLRHLQSMLQVIVAFIPPLFSRSDKHIHNILYQAFLMLPNDFFTDGSSSLSSKAAIFRSTVLEPYFTRVLETERLSSPHIFAKKTDDQRRAEYYSLDVNHYDDTPASIRIWIDALCINQSDVAERNREVARMRTIYESSDYLAIWLGEPSTALGSLDASEVSSAFSYVEHICAVFGTRLGTASTGLHPRLHGLISALLSSEHPLSNNAGTRAAFDRLLADLADVPQWRDDGAAFGGLLQSATWFRRMWCIQELAVAGNDPVALCGTLRVPWVGVTLARQIRRAIAGTMVDFLDASGNNVGQLFEVRREVQEERQRRKEKKDREGDDEGDKDGNERDDDNKEFAARLENLLYRCCSRFQATDAHDIVYALVGLATADGKIPTELKPRYDTPLDEVYRRYAAYVVRHTGNLTCLMVTESGLPEGTPSWVPDWRGLEAYEDRACARVTASHVALSEDGLRLEVEGIHLSTLAGMARLRSLPLVVESLQRAWRLGGSGNSRKIRVEESAAACLRETLLSLERVIEVICASLPYEFDIDEVKREFVAVWMSGGSSEEERRAYEVIVGRREAGDDVIDGETLTTMMMQWAWKVASLENTTVGITRKGQVLFAVRKDLDFDPGDEVCMLKGAVKPCILRREGDGYKLKGGCVMVAVNNPDETFYVENPVERFLLL